MRAPTGSVADLVTRPFLWMARRRNAGPPTLDRSYWAKRWIAVLLFVVAIVIVGIVQGRNPPSDPDDDPYGPIFGMIVLAFGTAFVIDRRIRRNRVADVAEAAGGTHVLYLRSFAQSGQVVKHLPTVLSPHTWRSIVRRPRQWFAQLASFHRLTLESLLRRACRSIAPVVAIGEPGEVVPSSSLLTEYLDGDAWRRRVVELMTDAELVVISAGHTSGVVDEVGLAISHVDPECLLIFVGRGASRNEHPYLALFGWCSTAGAKREAFYEEFRRLTTEVFPVPLPVRVGRHRFIRFRSDWQPILVSGRPRPRDSKSADDIASKLDYLMTGAPA